jgi:hypothetical protein
MPTMFEALADHYKVHLSPDDMAELQANKVRATDNAPRGTTVPSKRQNQARSGRAARKAYQGRKVLAAVGGVSGPWTRAAQKPADYKMCKIVTGEDRPNH